MNEEKPLGKYLKQVKGKGVVILLILLGVILLFFGGNVSSAGTSKQDTGALSTETYQQDLTAEITALCRRVEGVGDLSLVLTFTGGEQAVYAQNTDAGGGKQYILSSGDGLLLYRAYPSVSGVAVVCTGGDSPTVQAKLTYMLSALLGIGTNRISVTKGS